VTKYAVYAATTGGAVQIERLTPERSPQSLVCLGGTAATLPMSGEYDDFVRRGSGVIEREFGPFEDQSFRADVSGQIGSGQSWQLAFFLAHAVAASPGDKLCANVEDADHIIWATGRVDYDLNILPVDHVAEKLAADDSFFQKFRAAGKDLTCLMPLGSDGGTQVGAIAAACEAVGISFRKPSPATTGVNGKIVATAMLGLMILGGILIVSASTTGPIAEWRDRSLAAMGLEQTKVVPERVDVQVLKDQQAISGQDGRLDVRVSILDPPTDGSCAQVAFAGRRPVVEPLSPDAMGRLPDRPLVDVCGLRFTVDVGVLSRYVAMRLNVESGRFLEGSPIPAALSGALAVSGRQSWSITLPRRMPEGFDYRLTVVSGSAPVAGEGRSDDVKTVVLRQRIIP
jgi:hypothetical protein